MENEAGNVNVITPPPGAGIPVDTKPADTPPAPVVKPAAGDTGDTGNTDDTKPAGESGKVKLPASIKPPIKNGRFQARISDLVNQRNAVERENAELKGQLSRMRGIPKGGGEDNKGGVPAGGTEIKKNTGEGLNPEDFATYGDYITALVTKTMEQNQAAEKSARANQQHQEHQSARLSEFNRQAEVLANEYGDGFWDAITDPSLQVSEAMVDAILELDQMGPFAMLYLAAHKDEAEKISKLNPRAATIAIGRLALRLENEIASAAPASGESAAAAPTAPAAPAAPRPSPVPVPRGSASSLDEANPSDKDSVEDWLMKETNRLRRINPNARFYGAR